MIKVCSHEWEDVMNKSGRYVATICSQCYQAYRSIPKIESDDYVRGAHEARISNGKDVTDLARNEAYERAAKVAEEAKDNLLASVSRKSLAKAIRALKE